MQAKQFNIGSNSIEASIKPTSLTQILAIGTLAIGASVGIAAAPAHAVAINNGQLAFNDGVINTSGTIAPGLLNTFTASFNSTNAVIVSTSTQDFLPLFTPGAKSVIPSTATFVWDGGLNYKNTGALVFDFNVSPATSGTLTIAAGSTFLDTPQSLTHSNFSFQGTSATFFQGGITTIVPLTSFNFDVDNLPLSSNPSANGSFSLVTNQVGTPPSTAVPEPFTVIGTLVGGTAAARMRKKLAATQK